MMPLAMASFSLQLESIMFSLIVFGAILLSCGITEAEAAVGGLSSHDLAKRAAGGDTVLELDSGIRKRHPRVKRTPGTHWRGGSHGGSSSDYEPIPTVGAIPTTKPFYRTTRFTPSVTNNFWSPPYTGGLIFPKTTQIPFYWVTTRNGGRFQTTQRSDGWVPTARWTGPSTKGPWMPVHTNPWRPPAPRTRSTESPEVIEFTPSPNPQSGLDAVTTRYIIIGSVSGGVLIIVIVFIIVAVLLYRHKLRPPAKEDREMKALPPPAVSNTSLGTKGSRQSRESNRSKSSQPDSYYENP